MWDDRRSHFAQSAGNNLVVFVVWPGAYLSKLSRSRNFGRRGGRTYRVFNVAPDCRQINDVSSLCRGDITARALDAFPRALNFGTTFFLPLSFLKKAATTVKPPHVVILLLVQKSLSLFRSLEFRSEAESPAPRSR